MFIGGMSIGGGPGLLSCSPGSLRRRDIAMDDSIYNESMRDHCVTYTNFNEKAEGRHDGAAHWVE